MLISPPPVVWMNPRWTVTSLPAAILTDPSAAVIELPPLSSMDPVPLTTWPLVKSLPAVRSTLQPRPAMIPPDGPKRRSLPASSVSLAPEAVVSARFHSVFTSIVLPAWSVIWEKFSKADGLTRSWFGTSPGWMTPLPPEPVPTASITMVSGSMSRRPATEPAAAEPSTSARTPGRSTAETSMKPPSPPVRPPATLTFAVGSSR